MPKRERVVCGPHLPGTAPTETFTEGGCDETLEEDEADTTYPYDRQRFLPFPACADRPKSSPCILFYRRQFPVYPEGAPTEAWDTLRLHLGHVVHQAAFDLNLPIYAVAAAVSAFHAVFPGHFTKEELCSSPHIVSRCMAACLFLAGKTSETNLKLREAVNCIDFLQWKTQQQHRLNTPATSNSPEKQHESSEDSEKTGTTDGSDEQKSSNTSSVSSCSQQSKAEKQQGIKAEQKDGEGSRSSAPSAAEGQEKKDTDRRGQLCDEGKRVGAGVSDSGTKRSVKGGQCEEGSTQEEGSSGGTARSQSHRGENSKSRTCGIAGFSRSSRYLKGYVPMGIREYWHVRQECLREEERLLQALGFSLPLPYLYDVLLEAIVLMLPTHQEAHLIWAITNDIAATPLLEQFSPPILIAAAALCAKKLLAVAASFRSVNQEALSTSATSSNSGVVLPSFAGRTSKDTTLATVAEAKLRRVHTASERSDKLSRSSVRRSSGSSSSSSGEYCGVPLASQLLYRCKTEPKEEAGGQEGPDIEEPTSLPEKTTAGKAEQARKSAIDTSPVGAAVGECAAAAASATCDGNACAAIKAKEEMLEVLERLDPLLCGSPEYWTLCKGHERRGLERGGSRWARALPPAALGWTVFNPPDSARAAGDSTDRPVTVDVAPPAEPIFPSAACERALAVSVQLNADETTGATGDRYAAAAPETEEQAERKRLLKEKQEDQCQRKLVYVQIAEACARLMEVYSLLLKSQRAPSKCSPPAT